MQEKRRKYSPEFKAEAARLVIETSRPIVEVARELGIHEGTLGAWVNNTGSSMPAMNHR
jgi:transposase-like protein